MQHPFIFVRNIRMILIYINDINWWYHFPISTQFFIITIIVIHSFLTLPHQPPNMKKNTGHNDLFCIARYDDSRAIPLRMQIARLIEEGTLPQDLGWCPFRWVENMGISYKSIGESSVSLFKKSTMTRGIHHFQRNRCCTTVPVFFSANFKKSRSLDVFDVFLVDRTMVCILEMSCTDDPQSNVAGLECEQSKLKPETPQCHKDDQCRTSVTMFTEDGDQLDVDMSSSCLFIPGSKFFWPMGKIENSRSSADHQQIISRSCFLRW